jgi:putative chromosome segregation ATPase
MKEMYFDNILIADIVEKTAHFHKFEKGFNVVTSQDNHVGKSSLLKSLYFAMGAEVDFDNVWNKNTKLYVVEFYIDEIKFSMARWQKAFAFFRETELILTTKSVSRELARKFEKIFSFAVYMANKKTNKIELAPPAFTFMPYYIDQDKGWSGLYESFSNIDQYKKSDRIKSLYYHLGIYTRSTVELMAKRDTLKDKIEQLKEEEEKSRITIESLYAEIQNLLPADSIEELEKNLIIPKERISLLVSRIGETRNKIQSLETALYQHEHQLEVIQEYRKIKNGVSVREDRDKIHICPKCGYSFDEEIYSIVRSNYNLQNEDYMYKQIEQIISSIASELEKYKENYVNLMDELKQQEQAYDEKQDSYEVYLRQRGLQDSVRHFTEQLGENVYEQEEHGKEIKKINKEIRKLPNKKEVEENYIENVRLNIIKLDAWNSAYEGNIKLLKPIKAQGTLENKIILAQMIGLFQTMQYFRTNTILFPLVVDSPRAKEASHTSSKDILKLIFEMDNLPQVILATMDYSDFENEMKRRAKVTVLFEKRKLLNGDTYREYQSEIEELQELLSSF